uniref:Uncharacterized protein n=1 Tax=Arundo donax TaxID=35708 RepID=A0A0A9A9X4_ARUDO
MALSVGRRSPIRALTRGRRP